ncbi:MAG TPA: hypothetical protein VNI61_10095 [Gemmatimonadales bacterium]|nr:hypothetical protein [Gemmatimonadales bacterium]
MDEGTLALLIPVLAVGGFFAWMIAVSPVGKAVADRIRRGPGAGTGRAGAAPEELLAAIEDLRREVAELAERVDFTERFLARQREGERLGPPR